MSETLGNMRTRVASKLGGKSSHKTEIINALNEASQQVAWQLKIHEAWNDTTFTTTDEDYDYDIGDDEDIDATDVYAPFWIRNETDECRLTAGTFDEFLRVYNSDSDTGQPSKWCRYKNQIILYNSIPDGGTTRTLRIYYIKLLTKMAADTSSFQLNDEWIRPVEEFATALMLKDLRDFDAAAATLQAYNELIRGRETPRMIDDSSPEGGVKPISNTMNDGFIN